MKPAMWVLDADGSTRPTFDAQEFDACMSNKKLITLAKDKIFGLALVSTTFLGKDQNPARTGGPVLFETVIKSPIFQGHSLYTNQEEALLGHDKAVRFVKIHIQ